MPIDIALIIIALLSLGVAGGFLAGLLGIGGGSVFVPGLYYILTYFGYTDNAMHSAVGTSLLIIIVTGLSSSLAHYRRNAVDLTLFKNFMPGVLIGVGLGIFLADMFSTSALKFIFASSQIGFGVYMLLPHRGNIVQAMPKQPWFSVIAACNACLSSLMGVGGGIQNVTYMTVCNVSIHRAIGTAAAIGPIIATIGAGGYLLIGLEDPNLPPFSIGYLNLIGFGVIIASSALCAPLGARAAHALPAKKLKFYFGLCMMVIAARMLYEIFLA